MGGPSGEYAGIRAHDDVIEEARQIKNEEDLTWTEFLRRANAAMAGSESQQEEQDVGEHVSGTKGEYRLYRERMSEGHTLPPSAEIVYVTPTESLEDSLIVWYLAEYPSRS